MSRELWRGQIPPGQTFTLGVLAARPVMLATSAKAASVATVAVEGGSLARGATVGSAFGALLGPVLGVVCGCYGLRTRLKESHTPRERALVIGYGKSLVAAVVLVTTSLLVASVSAASVLALFRLAGLLLGY